MQIQTIHWRSAIRKAARATVYRREVIASSNPALVGQQLAVAPRIGEPLVFVGGGVAGRVTAVDRQRVALCWQDWRQEIRRLAAHYRRRDADAAGDAPWIADWSGGLTPFEAWARRCFKAA